MMAQRRDSKGRFAGSGAVGSSRRTTSMGLSARRNAATLKQEQAGNKERQQFKTRDARTQQTRAAMGQARGGSAGRLSTKQAAASRKKGATMERERRSLLRRGSMRGGGSERMGRSI
jgi:hypothetical protein